MPGEHFAARDLGVLADNKVSMSQQRASVALKANQLLGCICRSITRSDGDMIILQYSVLVRLHPVYCVQLWSPQLKTVTDRLEKVHRSAVKVIKRAEEPAL